VLGGTFDDYVFLCGFCHVSSKLTQVVS
jgi:hypothetical protein